MSMDTTDDLEFAELCLAAAHALEDYCRPTCQGEGEPCGDDTCGCPCHDREPAPTPHPVPLVEVLRDYFEDDDGSLTVIDGVEWRYTDGIGFHHPELPR